MKNKYLLVFLPLLTILSFSSLATDVVVTVNGSVVLQTCDVVDDNHTVNFGELNQGRFRTVGSVSTMQSATIKLEGCTSTVENLTYKFSGQPEPLDPTLLKVVGNDQLGTSDLVTGLAIQILDENENPLKLNQSYKLTNVVVDRKYAFKFNLRYKSVSIPVTVGNASSVLFLDFYYE